MFCRCIFHGGISKVIAPNNNEVEPCEMYAGEGFLKIIKT
jgi:hypothetical protein